MRILSNFKDYYDIGQQLGQDQTLVWERKSEEVCGFDLFTSDWDEFFGYNVFRGISAIETLPGHSLKVSRKLLVWGTQVKPIIQVRLINSKAEEIFKEFADEPDFDERLQGIFRSFAVKDEQIKRFFKQLDRYRQFKVPAHRIKQLTDEYKTPLLILDQIHLDRGESFTSSRLTNRILVNPCLAGLNLASRLDPYQLYQELFMWVAAKRNEAETEFEARTPATEPEKLNQHGFDRYSFKSKAR